MDSCSGMLAMRTNTESCTLEKSSNSSSATSLRKNNAKRQRISTERNQALAAQSRLPEAARGSRQPRSPAAGNQMQVKSA